MARDDTRRDEIDDADARSLLRSGIGRSRALIEDYRLRLQMLRRANQALPEPPAIVPGRIKTSGS